MEDCRVLDVLQTDRPADTARLLPTIREVLGLAAVAAALPEVLVGEDALDHPVRWVHVAETVGAAGLLDGGELVLATGVGWPRRDDALARHIADLAHAGAVGIVLELGERYRRTPEALVAACDRLGLPLVVLNRQARFVSITEAVHRRIISEHSLALQARDDVHSLFTELGLRGSPADYIIERLGETLDCPVVLEDLTHRVVAAAGIEEGALALWERASRAAHRLPEEGDAVDGGAWLIRPVEARGTRWGHLVALPGEPHPAGRAMVLEQAAVALALSRLTDPSRQEWLRLGHRQLVDMLLGGRYRTEASLAERLEAAGLPLRDRRLAGLALWADSPTEAESAAVGAAKELGVDAVAAFPSTGASAGPRTPLHVVVSLPHTHELTPGLLRRFLMAFARAADVDPRTIALGCGSDVTGVAGLLGSLEGAVELLRRRDPAKLSDGPLILRVQDHPLQRFMGALAGDSRLQDHVERMLGPLLDYDAAHDGDLAEVLAAYTAHPGNRTRAAAASHLSRSVFYQRLALIEDLLGVDLDDGEAVSALHAALLARAR